MIWCVEDDVSIRDIEIYTLEQTGFTAKGFCDGDSFWVELAYTAELSIRVIIWKLVILSRKQAVTTAVPASRKFGRSFRHGISMKCAVHLQSAA